MTIEVNDSNFEDTVLKSETPVLVDFWAEWCGPCRMVAPVVEELSSEYEGRVKMTKLNVDDSSETTAKFGIRNIPTILFFKNGEIVDKQVGAVQKSALISKIEALL